ncbi:DUF6382 domain-containing protein [Paenibacillus assamensis]|uniref:DUF6382 domain-containing protein n=1 Tax=Paenibacillus assamensis TaxID=311244 RepID=UPI000419EFEC|nr:DUF6382 domain-containing protein [Paenibacillus assamensis]
MYGYKADFVHDGKVMMKVVRDPAIRSDELDMHAIKMMQRHPIPQMLTLDVREIDFNVELYFDISGKKMLQQLFRSEKLTEMQLYEWLLQLMRMVEDCRSYMLHPNQLLLHEQFIFIEGGIAQGVLYVPYIPIQAALHENSMMESMCRLAIQLSGSVSSWKGDTFQQMVRMLHDGSYSITQVRQFVQTAIAKPLAGVSTWNSSTDVSSGVTTGRTSFSEINAMGDLSRNPHTSNTSNESYNSIPPVKSKSSMSGIAHSYSQHTAEARPSMSDQMNANRMTTTRAMNETNTNFSAHLDSAELQYRNQLAWPEPDAEEDSGELQPLQSQSPIIGVAIAVIISVLGWKFGYMESRDSIGMLLSSTATAVALFMGFAWWKGWFLGMVVWFRNGSKRDKAKSTQKKWSVAPATGMLPDFASVELPSTLLSPPTTTANPQKTNINSTPSFVRPPFRSPERVSLESHYDDMSEHTTLMSGGQFDATTLLDSSVGDLEANAPIIFSLERLASDERTVEEAIPITEWPFIIGRGAQGVHHALSLMGISKMHCELNRHDGQYVIQDLGSKNGTELQNDMLIPYKKYPLHEGDHIRIIDYVYRVSMKKSRASRASHIR